MTKEESKAKSKPAKTEAKAKALVDAKSLGLQVPGVYRRQGYLVLALCEISVSEVADVPSTRIEYIDVDDRKLREDRTIDFPTLFFPLPAESPTALALNLMSRAIGGTFEASIQLYRRLIEMALDRKALMKMSERQFAREYSRLMKLEHPVTRISASARAGYVDTLMKALSEEQTALDAPVGEEGSEGAGAATPETQQPPAAASTSAEAGTEVAPAKQNPAVETQPKAPPTETKGIGMAAKKKPKALAGAAATKKAAGKKNAESTYSSSTAKNPFREGCMKYKAFELFKKGGTRAAIIAGTVKIGATEATASSWINIFRKLTAKK